MTSEPAPEVRTRRSIGGRDLLVALAVVAVVFGVGVALDAYDRAERWIASFEHADEILALSVLLVLALGGVTIVRQRRFAVERQHRFEAEASYRALVEEVPAIAYTWDPVARAHRYVSPQIQAILGYTPEEWAVDFETWSRFVHPDDRERALAASIESDRTAEDFALEYRVTAADGRVVWIRDESRYVAFDHGGRPTLAQGVMFDITERTDAERRARESEERYRRIVERVPTVTYTWGGGEEPAGTPATFISPQIDALLGITREAALADPDWWWEAVHHDDRDGVVEAWEDAVRRRASFAEEYRIRHADGRWVWVRDEANPLAGADDASPTYQGVLFDVTERRDAEQRLRDAEHRWRTLLDHLPVTAYRIDYDTEDDTLYDRWIAPSIHGLLGYTPQEWLDDEETWARSLDPRDRDRIASAWDEVKRTGGRFDREYRMRRRDGSEVWIHEESTIDVRGTRVLAEGVLTDVTERKLAEQALRESERHEREAADRLRALDDMKNTFLAAVSHELRSPLTSILGLSLTLERAPDMADEDRGDLLLRLATNARKLDRLLRDLLDIDRLNRGIVEPQHRPTDVGALARHTVEGVDALAGREVVVRAEPIVIAVDAAKVERIVENLLINATRHTPTDKRIWLTVAPERGGVLIAVEDEGPGVPEELRSAIFEPFRQGPTTSPHSPGTGIGLSLVARFAELHGGRAWVEERAGGGASFRVFLPGDTEDDAQGARDGRHVARIPAR